MGAAELGDIGAVVVDCDSAALDAAGLSARLRRLSALGVHALVTEPGNELLEAQIAGPPPEGPGRLVTWSGDPPDVRRVGHRRPAAQRSTTGVGRSSRRQPPSGACDASWLRGGRRLGP